jgi:hypothetical protein
MSTTKATTEMRKVMRVKRNRIRRYLAECDGLRTWAAMARQNMTRVRNAATG